MDSIGIGILCFISGMLSWNLIWRTAHGLYFRFRRPPQIASLPPTDAIIGPPGPDPFFRHHMIMTAAMEIYARHAFMQDSEADLLQLSARAWIYAEHAYDHFESKRPKPTWPPTGMAPVIR